MDESKVQAAMHLGGILLDNSVKHIAELKAELSEAHKDFKIQNDEICQLQSQLFTAKAEIAKYKADYLLSTSEYCHKYRVQNCTICERLTCCDNTSDAARELFTAKAEIEGLREGLRKLEWIGENDYYHGQRCPVCSRRERDCEYITCSIMVGHKPDCWLAILLGVK